jgi:signal transduction protein with GAF and PtsI domain
MPRQGTTDLNTMDSAINTLLSASNIDWQSVLDAAIASFNGTTGTLHRLDAETDLLALVAQRGIPPQLMPVIEKIPVGKGIAGAAAERREPVELCNLQADLGGVAKPGARATNVQGSLAVPCLLGGTLRGTLGVGMMVPHDFSEEEKARLMEIGRAVADRL